MKCLKIASFYGILINEDGGQALSREKPKTNNERGSGYNH